MHDLVIRDTQLIDGTGGPRRPADVAVDGGRIVKLGSVSSRGRREIDAGGRVVTPGFIDIHTHFDAQVFWDPTLSPSPLHGVTTVVGGNCGFSIAPLDEASSEYLMRMLARVEGMPLESLAEGVPWDWHSTGEFLDRIDGTLAINAGFLVGHSALRRVVMGEAATERTATVDEVAAMQGLLRAGLQDGGLGFSSSWSTTHNDAEGRPVPSRWADAAELEALAGVCAEVPGTSLEFLPRFTKGPFDDDDVDLMARMSVAAGRPLNWNVLQVTARSVDDALAKLAASDTARDRGGRVVGLTIPMLIVGRFSFRTGFVLDALPGWAEPMALPVEERRRLLSDPDQRRRLNELSKQPGPFQALSRWDRKVIDETFTPENQGYRGRVVGDIAAEEGKDPFDALLDIVCTDELRTTFTNQFAPETRADWEARARIWRDDRSLIGASDAGAHLDFLGTFNYGTLVLSEAVRTHGVIPLEEAVHLLTQAPADLYGLNDRGRLAVGACADLLVLDEERVGSHPLTTRFDLPAGAGRLYAGATGVDHVIVGGTEIAADGELTDNRPGTVLRAGRHTTTPPLR